MYKSHVWLPNRAKKIVPKDKYVLCSMSSVFGNTSDNNMDMIAAIYNSLAQTQSL